MKPILEIQNISKKFRIQHENQPYLSLRDSLTSVFKKKTNTSEEFYALKDVSFTVNPGESVGIIGRNGAGKSTLLKILSSITPPSSGRIITRGRIASLLEVGTGFHPELTGRENVFLNGSILGMRRHEILKNFDAIVDFAGVEKFIDTPLKHYSSGMQLRLAFAVAAFLENEILIIDEVLAVGDAEFQKKCMGKMEEVTNTQGRTVLFVSHNMAAVKSLCQKGIVLKKGKISYLGNISNSVNHYLLGTSTTQNKITFENEFDSEFFKIHEISLNPVGLSSNVSLDEFHEIELNTKITLKNDEKSLHLTYVLKNQEGLILFTTTHAHLDGLEKLCKGFNHLICKFPKGFLNIDSYALDLYLIENSKSSLFVEKDILTFNVQQGERKLGSWMEREPGFIKPVFDWQILRQ